MRYLILLLLPACGLFDPVDYSVSDYESVLDKAVYESIFRPGARCLDVCMDSYQKMKGQVYLLTEWDGDLHCFVCDGDECRDNGYLSYSAFSLDEVSRHGDIVRVF